MDNSKPKLTLEQRAKRVIASQGKSQLIYAAATEIEIALLAGFCSEDGELAPDTAEQFRKFHIAFYQARKATDGTDEPTPATDSGVNAGEQDPGEPIEETTDLDEAETIEEPTELSVVPDAAAPAAEPSPPVQQ